MKRRTRSTPEELQRTGGERRADDGTGWTDSAGARWPSLRDIVAGAGLALAAGALITLAVVGALITLVVVSLGPTHRNGPGDGRHSRHLPVAVVPTSGLESGEAVQVHASRLAGAGEAIIAQCAAEADSRNRGVAACDLAHGSRVRIHRGGVETSFRVSRSAVLRDGDEVNCGSEAGRCVLMVASAENYDRSGFASLTFVPGAT